MRKLILLMLIFILGISSCNNPMKKSVIESLPIEDLKNIIDDDTLFEITYKHVKEIRELILTDDIEKAKWFDITYNRVHKIVKFYRDSLAQSKYSKKIKSDWNAKYGGNILKADSISDYWKNYKNERSLTNFVNIELFDIQTRDNGSAEIGFKITPLQGTLDDIWFVYRFIKKDDEVKISEWEKDSFINDRDTNVLIYNKVTESKIFWKDDKNNQDILKNRILEEVLDEYVFKCKLVNISKNRISLWGADGIPINIKWMLEAENQYKYEYYRAEVIKEYINEGFIRYRDYKSSKIDSIAKTIDPEAIKFLFLVDEK